MLRFTVPLCVAVYLTTSCLPAAYGADVTIDEVTAVPLTEYATLFHANEMPTGLVDKIVPSAGSTLWLVTYRATPQWDEATERIVFDNESFGLYDGDKRVTHAGSMYQFGIVDRSVGTQQMYRGANWKKEKAETQVGRFFAIVPNQTTDLELRMTQIVYDEKNRNAPPKKLPHTAKKVKLSGTPKPFDMNDHVEMKVQAVKMLQSLDTKHEADKNARTVTLVNEGGSIMQLTLQITPKQANVWSERREHFDWKPAWVGLNFGKGGRAVCAGALEYGTLSADDNEYIEQTDGGVWESKTVSLYFPVPANLKTFDVTFLGQKVANSAVQ